MVAETMEPRNYGDIKIGEKAEFQRQIRLEDLETFAKLTGDFNPLHFDEALAQRTFLRGRVVHGLLASSLISQMLGMRLPGKGTVYLSQALKFLKPVRIDETVTVKAEVVRKNEEKETLVLTTEIFNSRGEKVLTGEAEVKLVRIGKPRKLLT